ncbi:thioredoxin-dependent thiol peroxidase [Leptospira ellisii]|uniref:thioredoxin-dependent peroxiredoxin n=1 Tax=Leptospira ellisii TaxID=2023197 RepID=A0A2N0BAY5_9LEPT|nr:thioredoxin-dependent thiol peroxidase [Leptospira ellisii]MDV6235815.1 thioredoxin-dependent thiol peroxidase [Leptospira ellisii]PJZ93678.1 thioredoxin-dependent thiol peroxidase [Leptospira ellisii]PKA03913.1 thioredoxin-dependent thiol peroxidase [Leptospira ellisii]
MSELKVGSKAPSFTGLNEKGEKVKLSELAGSKGTVLYFYPKDSTPGCTTEACDFRDNFSRIKKTGFNVVGVSKDSVKSHQKFIEKQSLNFTLIADEDGKICEAYDVWHLKKFMGREFMGIVRTTFLIGADGKLLKIYPQVSVKGHVDEILADIKTLEKK